MHSRRHLSHLSIWASQRQTPYFGFSTRFFPLSRAVGLVMCVSLKPIDASRCTEIHTTNLPTPLCCRLVTWKSASAVAFAARWTCSTFSFFCYSSSLTPPSYSVGSPPPPPPTPAFILLITILQRLYYNDFPVM